MSNCCENYAEIKATVEHAAIEAGRNPNDILLLPVSKMVDKNEILKLYNIGIRDFAENRVQVFQEKYDDLPKDIRWHFIGPMQSNKVRKIVKMSKVIHSVESVDIILRIERIAIEENKEVDFLLEVNISGEASKGGVAPSSLEELALEAMKCNKAHFAGLMTMAPLVSTQDEQEKIFTELTKLKDNLESKYNIKLPLLSMGMSQDFIPAVKCGSTIVRVGSSIFF
jgi:pyridoxal phosphate enzyme (YggS family)